MAKDKLYMIRRKSDGLYSTGGSWITFSNNGKIWSSMRALNSHLTSTYTNWRNGCLSKDSSRTLDIEKYTDMKNNPYVNCEIVEAEIVWKPQTVSVFEHLATRYENRKK